MPLIRCSFLGDAVAAVVLPPGLVLVFISVLQGHVPAHVFKRPPHPPRLQGKVRAVGSNKSPERSALLLEHLACRVRGLNRVERSGLLLEPTARTLRTKYGLFRLTTGQSTGHWLQQQTARNVQP